MILNICEVYNKEFKENNFNLATSMLSMKATHFFIAANAWEQINIELVDTIPEGYLRCISTICKVIKVKIPAVVTDKTLHLLTELYPEKAGALRRCYIQQRPLSEVLAECLVQ